jgi:hypothetical protein
MNPQPTFADGPAVPIVVEGLLDATAVRQLFADLATHATLLSIRQKTNAESLSGTEERKADETIEGLLNGSMRAVQLRYRYEGAEWTDTLLRVAGGIRAVRCRHED